LRPNNVSKHNSATIPAVFLTGIFKILFFTFGRFHQTWQEQFDLRRTSAAQLLPWHLFLIEALGMIILKHFLLAKF